MKDFETFKAGFEAGRKEQSERDFPDVGIRFDRDAEDHFKDFIKAGPEAELPPEDEYASLVRQLDDASAEVTDWEADFIESLLGQLSNIPGAPSNFTDKQKAVLDRMAEKYL